VVFLFQHESADVLDPDHVDEIATCRQQGWSMDQAIIKVGRKKEREGDLENIVARRATMEAAIGRCQGEQVLCCVAEPTLFRFVLLWSSSRKAAVAACGCLTPFAPCVVAAEKGTALVKDQPSSSGCRPCAAKDIYQVHTAQRRNVQG